MNIATEFSLVAYTADRGSHSPSRATPTTIGTIVVTLVILAFLSILEPAEMTSSALNAARIAELGLLSLAALIISVAVLLTRCSLRWNGTPPLFLGLFAFWALASSLWSVNPMLSFARGVTLAMTFFVAIALAIYIRAHFKDTMQALVRIIALAMVAAIATLVALSVFYWGTPLPFTEDMAWSGRPGRLFLAYLVPLETGELLGLTIIILALAFRDCAAKFATIACLGYLLYITDARNVIAFVPVALVFAYAIRHTIMTRFLLATAVIFSILSLGILAIAGELNEFVPTDIETLNGRTPLWEIAFEQIFEQPFLGVGYYASRFYLGAATSFYAGHTHNAYIEVFMNLGIIGLALMLMILAQCVRYSFRDRTGVLIALLFVCLLGSIFNPLILVSNVHSFLLATCLVIVADLAHRPEARQAQDEALIGSRVNS